MTDEINRYLTRQFVKSALEMLSTPSLREVFDHPEKWRIVGIHNGQLVVQPVTQSEP